ncbi:uncharacterized protein LOC114366794 [Ostrinia furnacalis]|uniref:uncharacterized protein LOC114366794 n=1 Tax=Ostrinia furnacalis TaxID=93504 RepID=UPI00103D6931|nr:uncharacterized protein LOC114366794 [Ostrinia furnacalis]XP_028179573.1 uncharacterized protein LOC114366794 [Ostrinia furnacalis]
MSGDAEIGLPRPRPLSGGFWTLLSWLRREDHLSSSDSLSSAGSDRTAVSFAFLTPAHYHASAPPVVVAPPGPPTDTYKQRLRERNIRRQYDRDITLHRKYGLFRGEGVNGYDASTLPTARLAQGKTGNRQERERRATSECYQRRAAHVPGKRRAPQPPGRVLEPTASIKRTRKRPAPQPPIKLTEKSKENVIQSADKTIHMNAQAAHKDKESTCHDVSTDCKPEKYTKKDNRDAKIKPEKNFLKQIFENKKKNTTVDITSIKVLPSISELDAQAAEIIENKKIRNNENINHQTNIASFKMYVNCTKCTKKPCICATDAMSSILEESRNKNASTHTQTENNARKSTSNSRIDEKQKLKDMLKEMKDSLPKKTNHDTKVSNTHLKSGAFSTNSNKDTLVIEAPTLRIGSVSVDETNNKSKRASFPTAQVAEKTGGSCNVTIMQTKMNSIAQTPQSSSNNGLFKVNNRQELHITENKSNLTSKETTKDAAGPNPKTCMSNNRIDIGSSENRKLNTPLKISSLLNPIYIPKDTTSTQDVSKNVSKEEYPKLVKSETSSQTNFATAKAVRDIVLNSDLKRNQASAPSPPLISSNEQLKKTCVSDGTRKLSCVKPLDQNGVTTPTHYEKQKENTNVERLSQHLRRRELVNQLEQSIAKGDERAAAEAASKLAQLRLSCSVLSFTSQILSEPSTSKIQTEKNIQDQTKNDKSKINEPLPSKKSLAATSSLTEAKDSPKVVNVPTTSAIKVQEERVQKTGADVIKSSITESNASPLRPTTSKGLPSKNDADNIAINVWVEDKEKTRGPIKLVIRRAAVVGELRRRAEQSFGLPSRLQRWIVGRTLCTNDNTSLASLAGPSLSAPFYLCLVEADENAEQVNLEQNDNAINTKEGENNAIEKKSSDVYNELVQLEQQALVPNAEEFECEICMEQCQPGDGVVLRECVHSFCKGCLSDVIRHCEEPAVLCPATACPGELHEREIRALVSPEEYERWLARGLAAAESGSRNAFHCRTRDCAGWAMCEVGVRRFPCPVCKHTNCVPCQAIHENETCEQHRAKLLAAAATNAVSETDEGTRALIDSLIARGEALQCPECSAIITKKWGCDWVKCSACKTEICWVTRGRRWGPAGRGDTSGGCRCGVDGKRCHPSCGYCH